MPKLKLKWTSVEDIAFRLIDLYPDMDPLKLRFTDLHRYITKLPEFSDDPKKSNEKLLEAIQMKWYEERKDMEDELGPLDSYDENEPLDEDEYSDEEEASGAEDDQSLFGEEDEDDEDEDEFGEGFQEDSGEDR